MIARSTRYSAQAPQFRDYVAGLVRQIRATGVATNVQSYLASPNSSLVSRDGHATMLPIDVPTKGDITHVLSVLHKEKANPSFALDITGTDTLNHDFSQLGRWNWYLPRRLAWLPEVHIEGSPAQRHARAS